MPAPIIHETARILCEYFTTAERDKPHRTLTLTEQEDSIIVDGTLIYAASVTGDLLRLPGADLLGLPSLSAIYDALEG